MSAIEAAINDQGERPADPTAAEYLMRTWLRQVVLFARTPEELQRIARTSDRIDDLAHLLYVDKDALVDPVIQRKVAPVPRSVALGCLFATPATA